MKRLLIITLALSVSLAAELQSADGRGRDRQAPGAGMTGSRYRTQQGFNDIASVNQRRPNRQPVAGGPSAPQTQGGFLRKLHGLRGEQGLESYDRGAARRQAQLENLKTRGKQALQQGGEYAQQLGTRAQERMQRLATQGQEYAAPYVTELQTRMRGPRRRSAEDLAAMEQLSTDEFKPQEWLNARAMERDLREQEQDMQKIGRTLQQRDQAIQNMGQTLQQGEQKLANIPLHARFKHMAQENVTPEMTEAYEQRRPSTVYNYAYEPTKTERFKAGLGTAGRGLYDYGVEPVFVRPTNWAKARFAAKPVSEGGAVAPAMVTPAVQGAPATGYRSYIPSLGSVKSYLPSAQYLRTGVPEGFVDPASVVPAVQSTPAIQGSPATGYRSYIPSLGSVKSYLPSAQYLRTGVPEGFVDPASVAPAVQSAPAVQGAPATSGYWGSLWSKVPSKEQVMSKLPSAQYLRTGVPEGFVDPASVESAQAVVAPAVQGSPATSGYWGSLWSKVPSREQVMSKLPSAQYLRTGVPEGFVDPASEAFALIPTPVEPAAQGAPATGGYWSSYAPDFKSYIPSWESVKSKFSRATPAQTPAALGQ